MIGTRPQESCLQDLGAALHNPVKRGCPRVPTPQPKRSTLPCTRPRDPTNKNQQTGQPRPQPRQSRRHEHDPTESSLTVTRLHPHGSSPGKDQLKLKQSPTKPTTLPPSATPSPPSWEQPKEGPAEAQTKLNTAHDFTTTITGGAAPQPQAPMLVKCSALNCEYTTSLGVPDLNIAP